MSPDANTAHFNNQPLACIRPGYDKTSPARDASYSQAVSQAAEAHLPKNTTLSTDDQHKANSRAIRNGNKATVELLLATNRVDVDSKDYYNSTPLSIAARMGHKDVVAFLLTKSHALNIQDNFGRTPLWWARRTGHPDIADLHLEKCKEDNIVIQEDDLPTTVILVPDNKYSKHCDVCVLGVLEEDTYHHCRDCNGGDFNICEECFTMKAHCLDQSHTLIKEIVQRAIGNTQGI